MAGTRGIAKFRGEQLKNGLMRDTHFDVNNKINENKVDINWRAHREILEDTKVDVFVQVNDVAVGGASSVDVTSVISGYAISDGSNTSEGVVLSQRVILRQGNTADTPVYDSNGDVVYGKITQNAGPTPTFTLSFYSDDDVPFTMPAGMTIDYKFVLRTNMSVIPVDAIINGGGSFVEGATDSKAYLNIQQLVKDLYGATGTADNDGNSNLTDDKGYGVSVLERINNFIDAIKSTAANQGADIVGVVPNTNYTGVTVQDVLDDLALRLKNRETEIDNARSRDVSTTNGYFTAQTFTDVEGRFNDIEQVADAQFKSFEDRLDKIDAEDEEEVYEATGGETSYTLVNGPAKEKSVLLFVNGAAQAPGINFAYTRNAQNQITGFNFAPETLKGAAQNPDGVPDVLFVKYKKIL
ncbi:hypothetical protein G3578_09190 [Brevibacillus sp. SYP-B805]|uniref:hypothetical protein n=1 Tax=Brevibacillus sp. SYP-B805 TaxID=1578199 RepID=UPI0013EB210D|nr:hypothetical protein [Brevibacillus sp. SYP-B805]NGQ95328.1 hypothetical protein [Brevibacillus sp. SYP-B805]